MVMKYLATAGLAFIIGIIGTGDGALAQQQSVDPSRLSEWKVRKQVNLGTVRIISGGIESTAFRTASEVASVVNGTEGLRLLSIIGQGSLQNLSDVLLLRRVHLGIVQADVLDHVIGNALFPAIERRIHYISKLYNDEVHILARREIGNVAGLAGKTVNIGPKSSGTFITASGIFKTLGIPIRPVHLDPTIALEQLRTGEISALVYVEGKPISLLDRVEKDWNLHLLPLENITGPTAKKYEPASLTSKDYPNIVPADEQIQTVSVPNVLIVLNFKPDTSQYADLAKFIDAFYKGIPELRKSPYHPKWTEVNLTSDIEKWTRFPPAVEAANKFANLTANSCAEPVLRAAFLKFYQEVGGLEARRPAGPQGREKLFKQFQEWLQKKPN